MLIQEQVNKLFESQIEEWQLAKENYSGLQKVETKEIFISKATNVKVQFNPERIKSSAAKVDKKTISERPCFLCSQNRPKEQQGVDFKDFNILVNPYPIFPRHLTIVHNQHRMQEIKPFFASMLEICKSLPDYTVFYNGPKCGASAPDHFHFQAGIKNFLPIEEDFHVGIHTNIVKNNADYQIFTWQDYYRSVITIKAFATFPLVELFQKIYDILENLYSAEPEPMLNILAYYRKSEYIVHIFPRMLHRPKCYFAEGEEQILLSPASVDMGGVFITPRKEDFQKINTKDIISICNQVCITESELSEIIKNI